MCSSDLEEVDASAVVSSATTPAPDTNTTAEDVTAEDAAPAWSQDELQTAERQVALLTAQVSSLQQQLDSAHAEMRGDCSEHCHKVSQTGRWQFGQYGHDCADPLTGKTFCHCSHVEDNTTACEEVLPAGERRRLRARGRRAQHLDLDSPEGPVAAPHVAAVPATAAPAAAAPAAAAAGEAPAAAQEAYREIRHYLESPPPLADPERRLGSNRETISDYCNATGLALMHGAGGVLNDSDAVGDDPSALNQLESSILADVASEMEDNNVDQMARDTFSFYICVRWVPDAIFWKLAKQEMATDLLNPVSGGEGLDQAVSELYQNYKYVPLLCSKNLDVFSETDDDDNTYFRRFKKDVDALSQWLDDHETDEVATKLVEADEIFCGEDKPMNDDGCLNSQSFLNWAGGSDSWVGSAFNAVGWDSATAEEKWAAMASIFQSFNAQDDDGSTFHASVMDWKSKFPFHSFVHKQAGMSDSGAPKPTQRSLVCFGKRVASQLHRRPAGQHIMTDQNNVGCHGFWTITEVKGMLQRMVTLWRPPTCQMAEMTYVMKKQILKMYAEMNKRLFDAMPTMLMDEELAKQGVLDAAVAGPQPYDPQEVTESGITLVEGMRVRSTQELQFGDCSWCTWGVGWCDDCVDVAQGTFGYVAISDENLAVLWDGSDSAAKVSDSDCNDGSKCTAASALEVVPKDYGTGASLASVGESIVAGVTSIVDFGTKMFNDMFRDQYTSLAELMSNSTSKWAVCPVSSDANYTELDSQLGVEDAAFRDFQMEAYASWTGYVAQVPGEVCIGFEDTNFPQGKTCEISELHADHIEKYTMDDGSLEQFLCPVKTSLGAAEQLTVLKQHTDDGQCLLRMTTEQMNHYQWPYNGGHMARRQYDRKPNVMNVEYELIKLEHVPSSGKVSFARLCSPDQQAASPRFCGPIELHSQWPTLQDMADDLAEAATGSAGLAAGTITNGISAYQKIMAQESWSDTGTYLKESAWDTLTGASRLLTSAGASAISALSDGVPGGSERDRRIEHEMFGESEAGVLLHSLSYQHSIGNNGLTSNAKERYQRYVVTMPCAGFNPAAEFAVRKKWVSVALRMLQEECPTTTNANALLAETSISIAIRGEARLFLTPNAEAEDTTFFSYGAAIKTMTDVEVPSVTCTWSLLDWECQPSSDCVLVGNAWTGTCSAKVEDTSIAGWEMVSDGQLSKVVAPTASDGSDPVTELKGLSATYYCGPKSAFTDAQPGPTTDPASLKTCLEDGVRSNAELHATYPWKLYFPEEVVVMVVFADLSPRQCSKGTSGTIKDQLCAGGATETTDLDSHLSSEAKESSSGTYQGLATGSGYPKSTPTEVWLRPEDVLEASGLLSRS